MNEKEADAIRKSMYESLLMDENDKIVHWDFDPMRRELREYVDIACGCDEQTYGIRTPQFELSPVTSSAQADSTSELLRFL